MATRPKTPPDWYSLSHHDRYRRLDTVRRLWCRRRPSREIEDDSGRTIHLEGSRITDVPSFYLALGEAINGPHGYFGGDLDALDDCLCGSFGTLPPLTIYLSHFDAVRNALDGRVWCRWRAESFQEAVDNEEPTEQLIEWGYFDDGSEADIARWTATFEAAFAGEPFDADDFGSYFEGIIEVFERRGVALVPE